MIKIITQQSLSKGESSLKMAYTAMLDLGPPPIPAVGWVSDPARPPFRPVGECSGTGLELEQGKRAIPPSRGSENCRALSLLQGASPTGFIALTLSELEAKKIVCIIAAFLGAAFHSRCL